MSLKPIFLYLFLITFIFYSNDACEKKNMTATVMTHVPGHLHAVEIAETFQICVTLIALMLKSIQMGAFIGLNVKQQQKGILGIKNYKCS